VRRPLFDLVVVVAVTLAVLAASARASRSAPARCTTVEACRRAVEWEKAERTRLAAAVAWQRRQRVELARHRWRAPVAEDAITLAALVTHQSEQGLRRLLGCESTGDTTGHRFNPRATNGRFKGLGQLGGHHLADPIIRRLGPFNPYASAMHVALYIKAHGEGEWQCTTSGGLRW
jgi:hypothetical protein